jgi:hypothetical protein
MQKFSASIRSGDDGLKPTGLLIKAGIVTGRIDPHPKLGLKRCTKRSDRPRCPNHMLKTAAVGRTAARNKHQVELRICGVDVSWPLGHQAWSSNTRFREYDTLAS